MAISLNGYIATLDGQEDFLSSDNWNIFADHVNKIGCLIWGHKTYQQVIKWPTKYLDSLQNSTKIVLAHDPATKLDPRFILANTPEQAIRILQDRGFDKAILTGGATNNTEFAKRGLINEVFLTVDSMIIGKGIPLFKPEDFTLELKLIEMRQVTQKVIALRYSVV